MDRLKASYDTLTVLEKDKDSKSKLEKETTKLCRVLKVLHEYVMECDADFGEERTFVPLYRAPRGKQIVLLFRLVVRFVFCPLVSTSRVTRRCPGHLKNIY